MKRRVDLGAIQEKKDFEEKVVEIKRVAKKTKGGSKISFTALVLVGNRNGRVGAGLGKAQDVTNAIQKGINFAKKNVIDISFAGNTIPHQIFQGYGSAKLLLKPVSEGTGVVAGGTVRQVLELAGVKNVSAKMLGSNNKTSNVRCAVLALKRLKDSYEARKTKKD